MTPLHPTLDVTANNFHLPIENAASFNPSSLDSDSVSVRTELPCYTGDSTQGDTSVLETINNIIGEAPPSETVYVLSCNVSPSGIGPCEVVSETVQTENSVKPPETSIVNNRDQCVIADLFFTKDDHFMCAKGDGPLLPVDNAEVLAKIRAAKTGEVDYREATSEEDEAVKSGNVHNWGANVKVYGVILISYYSLALPGLVYIHYKLYKEAQKDLARAEERRMILEQRRKFLEEVMSSFAEDEDLGHVDLPH